MLIVNLSTNGAKVREEEGNKATDTQTPITSASSVHEIQTAISIMEQAIVSINELGFNIGVTPDGLLYLENEKEIYISRTHFGQEE